MDAELQPDVDVARGGGYVLGDQTLNGAQSSEAEEGLAEDVGSPQGAGQMSTVRLAPRYDVSGILTESGSEIDKSDSTRTSARPRSDAQQLGQHVVDVSDQAAADQEETPPSTRSLGNNRSSPSDVHTSEPRRARSLQYASIRLCFAPH